MSSTKFIKAILIFILEVVFVLLILYVAFIYSTKYKKTLISMYKNDSATLKIYELGVPIFPYGESTAICILEHNNKIIRTEKIIIKNDGKKLDTENFYVEWSGDKVMLKVYGEEMTELIYEMSYSIAK